MANLKATDRLRLEKLFEMGEGFVLNFTNSSFQQFIRENSGLDIYASKYETYGDSKAKRLRAFWEIESDELVGKIISEMIGYWHTSKLLSESEITKSQEKLSKDCAEIADRLLGKRVSTASPSFEKSEFDFLQQDFGKVSLDSLKLESGLLDVLKNRINEIQKGLNVEAPLSVIFLCGSTLEGILLGVATQNPQKFNQAKSSPKDRSTGKVLAFHKWTLNDMINVCYETGLLGLDVKKFSHVLAAQRADR